MDKNDVLKLAPGILKRMEYGAEVFYLLNLKTDEIWTGNISAGIFISSLDGYKSVEKVILELKPLFETYAEEVLYLTFGEIVNELLEKCFLIKCNN